jgi:hypothetical protein
MILEGDSIFPWSRPRNSGGTVNRQDAITRLEHQLRGLLHYWFVQYNPLYFFSAFCVLFGTYLVSRGLDGFDWGRGQILLTVVIQAYEILLLGAIALLYRRMRQLRAAVILALVEIFFLFDPTFRVETIATLKTVGLTISMMWAILVVVKLAALSWIFRLKPARSVFVITTLAAFGMAVTPHVLGLATVDRAVVHLAATWYFGGLVAFFLWSRPRVDCEIDLDQWGRTVFRRAAKAAWMIWAGFYLYHLTALLIPFSLAPTLVHAAPLFLLLPFASTREATVWVGCLGALGVALTEPLTLAPTALVVALVLGWYGRRLQRHRLFVGAVMSVYLAVWTVGWQGWPWPEPIVWLNVLTAAALLLIAQRLRLPSALMAVVVVMLPGWRSLVPRETVDWGILLLAVGFLTLIVGVAVNWILHQQQAADSS